MKRKNDQPYRYERRVKSQQNGQARLPVTSYRRPTPTFSYRRPAPTPSYRRPAPTPSYRRSPPTPTYRRSIQPSKKYGDLKSHSYRRSASGRKVKPKIIAGTLFLMITTCIVLYSIISIPFNTQEEENEHEEATVNFKKGWQIVKTGYPTDDMVVIAKVMTEDNLPSNPESNDCSKAFNDAFQNVSQRGGGVVYAPEGEYLFTKRLIIPENVVLRGAWGSVHGSDKSVRGTIIKVTYNGLYTQNDPGFIQLHHRSGLRDLTIWYPEQDLNNIKPYAQTIDHADSFLEEIIIENVNLVNSYVGYKIDINVKRAYCNGLYGSPLKIGLFQFGSSSVPFFGKIYFSPDYWSGSSLPGAPSRSDLKNYLYNEATGIIFAGSDNIFASEWYVSDYKIGLHFIRKDPFGVIDGNMCDFYITNCKTAMLADDIGPSFFINSVFEGKDAGVVVKNGTRDGVHFNKCTFSSSSGHAVSAPWVDMPAKNLRFQNCIFDSTFFFESRYLTIVDSKFTYTGGSPIILSSNNNFALLGGNTFANSGGPVNLNGANANKVIIYDENTFSETFKSFDIDGYDKVRKPYAYNMIIMGSNGYEVKVDGVTDDAPQIQKALNDIRSMGGGIVLLPQISEDGYAIRSPLNVPEGVELRSSSEGMHSFDGGQHDLPAALLQIYHGREATEPTIILNKGSGLKGFTIHYPKQIMNDIVPYAVTVKIIGDEAYVVHNQFLNSYFHVEVNGGDNFLIEKNLIQPVHKSFKVVNSKNGRFNRITLRGEWDDSKLPSVVGDEDDIERYSVRNHVCFEVIGSTNIQFFACFGRVSKYLAVFRDSSVHALQLSMEACSNAILIDGIRSGNVELLGSSLRTDRHYDTGITLTMFDVSAASSDGDFRVYSTLCTGYPTYFININNANMIFQDGNLRLDDDEARPTSIKIIGSDPTIVRMENTLLRNYVTNTDIQDVSGIRLELLANYFPDDLKHSISSAQVAQTLDPSNLSDSIRLVDVINEGVVT